MKKQLRKGSMAIETALLMPVILLVIMTVLYLFFYVHNRAWLTAAAYEAALSGSMEAVSYTHLDVYKRQLLFCTQPKEAAVILEMSFKR